jgi:hypothetical protein
MPGTNVKRSQIQSFMNTTPSTTATYSLIGDGVTSSKISYNPETTKETYVHQDSATVTVDSYAPVMAFEATAKNGDAVFEFVDGLRRAQAVGAAADTDMVNVWMYETGGPTAYPAERRYGSVQVDDFGGDAGKSAKMNFTFNCKGDLILGTFNATTKVFTAS